MTGKTTDPEKDKAVDTTSTSEGNSTDTTDKTTAQVDTTSKAEGDKPKVFTQEEVNKLIGDTRKETRDSATKKALSELLTQVGAANPEELVGIVAEAKKLKEASLSEQERAKLALEEASKKVETLTKEKADALSAAQEAAIKAEVVKNAATRFEDADVVFRLIDRSGIKFDDSGNVEGVTEALEALAKQHPWMLRRRDVSQTTTANPSNATSSTSRDDAARRAEYFGMQQSDFWKGSGAKKILETD